MNELLFHIRSQLGVESKHRFLLALSGGRDSAALLHLLKEAGYSVAAAHANFQLRGEESDLDEGFCNDLCAQWGIRLFVKRFPTTHVAMDRGLSIQETARELRYQWLEEIRKQNGFHYLLTAHHAGDDLETLLLNILRGSGYKGWAGIPAENQHIRRPLLAVSRERIEEYIGQNKLTYRDDSSNSTDYYRRNFLRHKVIPLLKELNPSIEQQNAFHMQSLRQSRDLLESELQRRSKRHIRHEADGIYIPIRWLENSSMAELLLYHLLQPHCFNSSQCADIWRDRWGTSGAQYVSATHRLLRDRDHWILIPNELKEALFIEWNDERKMVECKNGQLIIESLSPDQVATSSSFEIVVDGDKLKAPFQLRNRRQADYFYPAGLGKKKKISRFLMDNKIPNHQKEQIPILLSNDRIVWVIGHRADQRFLANKETKNPIRLKWISK